MRIDFEGKPVEVPDDATEAEISEILGSLATETPPAATPAAPAPAVGAQAASGVQGYEPEPTFFDNYIAPAGRIAGQAARGVIEDFAVPLVTAPNTIQQTGMSVMNGALDYFDAPDWAKTTGKTVQEVGNLMWPSQELLQGVLTSAEDVVSDSTLEERGAQNMTEKGVRLGASNLAAAILPVGGSTMKLKALQRTAANPAAVTAMIEALPSTTRGFVQQAQANLPKFLQKELGAATAATVGGTAASQTAVEMGAERGGWQEQLATALGSVGGVAGTAFGTGVGKNIKDTFAALTRSPTYVSDEARKAAAATLIENSKMVPNSSGMIDTTDYFTELTTPKAIESAVPGYTVTAADAALDPNLGGLQAARAANPGSLNRFNQRNAENSTAIDAALAPTRPTQPSTALNEVLEGNRTTQLDDAQRAVQDAELAAENATLPLQPVERSSAARGNAVRMGLEDAETAANAQVRAGYDALNVDDLPVDVGPLSQSVDDVLGGMTETERALLPNDLVDRIRRMGTAADDQPIDTGLLDANGVPITRPAPPPEPQRLKEITDVSSEMGRKQRAAVADPNAEKGGRNAARVMGRIDAEIDRYIDDVLPPEKVAERAAVKDLVRRTKDRFTRAGDPVAGALARSEGGQPRMRDESVASSFVRSPQAMDRLFQEADTPATRASIRDEMLSNADTSTTRGLERFTTTHREQLERFPGLRQELETAAAARTAEAGARTSQTALIRDLGDGGSVKGRSAVAKYLARDATGTRESMRQVLKENRPGEAIDEILEFAGNDVAAVQGARAAFWENMEHVGKNNADAAKMPNGGQPWDPKTFGKFLSDPKTKAVADRLYRDDPDHLSNLNKIAASLEETTGMASRSGTQINPSKTKLSGNGYIPIAEVQSKYLDVRRGRLSRLNFVTSIGAKIARNAKLQHNQGAFDRLLDEALLDRDVAAALLKEYNPVNRAALGKIAKGYLGNQAASFMKLLSTDEEDEASEGDAVDQIARGKK